MVTFVMYILHNQKSQIDWNISQYPSNQVAKNSVANREENEN